jgi:MOSC domain-containing protein YiiM
MKILSVNVGRPRPISWEGHAAMSGIFKQPVDGPVQVKTLNLDGDQQADLTVHGGVHKAVYAYPSEHYAFWQSLYPERTLEWGAFGENLTTEGLLESSAGVGDTLQIGTVILRVVQPRLPCYKLAMKFQDKGILQRFTDSGRSGIYFAVETEGQLQTGASIAWIYRQREPLTIADAMRLYNGESVPLDRLDRALKVKALPDSWRKRIEAEIAKNNL